MPSPSRLLLVLPLAALAGCGFLTGPADPPEQLVAVNKTDGTPIDPSAADPQTPPAPPVPPEVARLEALREGGKAAQAVTEADAWRKREPDNLLAAAEYAESLRWCERFAEVETEVAAILKRDPKYGWAYGVRSLARNHTDRKAALLDAQKWVEYEPRSPRAHVQFGYAQYILGEHVPAVAAHTAALEIDPKHRGAFEWRSAALFALGQWEACGEDAQTAVAMGVNRPIVKIAYATSLVKLRKMTDAVAVLTKFLETEPKNPQWYNLRREAYEALGEKELAKKDRDLAWEHTPFQSQFWNPPSNRTLFSVPPKWLEMEARSQGRGYGTPGGSPQGLYQKAHDEAMQRVRDQQNRTRLQTDGMLGAMGLRRVELVPVR